MVFKILILCVRDYKLYYQSSQDKPKIMGSILCQKVKVINGKKSGSNACLNVLKNGMLKNKLLKINF